MSKEDSKTWPHVMAFAERMEKKLDQNRHKGNRDGWINDEPWNLFNRIYQESCELRDAIKDGESAEKIADECADVANFCMMVADWFIERAKP